MRNQARTDRPKLSAPAMLGEVRCLATRRGRRPPAVAARSWLEKRAMTGAPIAQRLVVRFERGLRPRNLFRGDVLHEADVVDEDLPQALGRIHDADGAAAILLAHHRPARESDVGLLSNSGEGQIVALLVYLLARWSRYLFGRSDDADQRDPRGPLSHPSARGLVGQHSRDHPRLRADHRPVAR